MDEAEFERRCGQTPLTRSGLERIRGNIAAEPAARACDDVRPAPEETDRS